MKMRNVAVFWIVSLFVFSLLTLTVAGAQDVLRADGSSTVYPIASTAAAYWNANPPASDTEYWGPERFNIDTDKNLAEYWAGLSGLEPFNVVVGLSHSGVGLTKVENGQVDIGDASAAVEFEFPDYSPAQLSKFTDHVVAKDHQAFSVSKEIYDAGVNFLTKGELVAIFNGDIKNWKQVGGPDREIQVVGRAVGSGTETMFRINVFGTTDVDPAGVDIRKGQNQMVKQTLIQSDNAIGYPGVDFVSSENPAIEVVWDDGNRYSVEDPGWPLGRELHMYTYQGTSTKEAAFLRMILSDFGQQIFVEESTDYYPLSEKEQAEALAKLPEIG